MTSGSSRPRKPSMSNTTILRSSGNWSRTSSALSSCSSSSTKRMVVRESSHRYCSCEAASVGYTPLDIPAQERIARSAHTHSTTVLARTDAQSPGLKPRLTSPAAISRTASAVWFQVQLRHRPRCFCRIQMLGPRFSTAFQNMAGMVSPCTTMSWLGCMLFVSQSPLMLSISRSSSFSSAARRVRHRP